MKKYNFSGSTPEIEYFKNLIGQGIFKQVWKVEVRKFDKYYPFSFYLEHDGKPFNIDILPKSRKFYNTECVSIKGRETRIEINIIDCGFELDPKFGDIYLGGDSIFEIELLKKEFGFKFEDNSELKELFKIYYERNRKKKQEIDDKEEINKIEIRNKKIKEFFSV